MSPGEEDDEEFGEDVAVGDVEVVFEGGHVDIAVELDLTVRQSSYYEEVMVKTYILLDILLSCIHGTLANLKAHLSSGVVHEASKSRMHVVSCLSLLALTLWR